MSPSPPRTMRSPADLEVDAAAVLLRTENLRLQSAEAAVGAARVRVQLAELDMEHALRRRQAARRPGDEDFPGASSRPSSPPAKTPKPTTRPARPADPEKCEELVASLRAQELRAVEELQAARDRERDLKQKLQQQSVLDTMDLQGANEHQTELTLATLPEDELLRVLRLLETKQLLQCRAVCRRLRGAALHPSLWRSRSLNLESDSIELVAATLRLTPCLRKLTIDLYRNGHGGKKYLRLGTLLVSTNCAIRCLDVTLTLKNDGLFTAVALARQAALGRLSAVKICLMPALPKELPSQLRLLLDQLLHTQGLTSLEVECPGLAAFPTKTIPEAPGLPKAAKCVIPMVASLRRLVYQPTFKDGILTSFLQWHGDTLQVVHLSQRGIWSAHPRAGVTPLLCSLPNLRELQCSFLENMPALLQCSKLKSLHLFVDSDEGAKPLLPEVGQFLRSAVTRLETLTLAYPDPEISHRACACADAVNLLLNLGGPPQGALPALVRFALDYQGPTWQPQPQLLPLAAVFHRLKHLVSLDLHGPPTRSFLEMMDGDVLPSLERLCVYLDDVSGFGCPHEWGHGEEPRAILRRYPRLHLEVGPSHCIDDCTYCSENECHWLEFQKHTLFSHPVDENKDCDQYHREIDFHIVL